MKTVVGLMANHRKAEDLIQELTLRGFRMEDIDRIAACPEGIRKEKGEEVSCRIEEFFGTEEKLEIRGYFTECVRKGAVLVSIFTEDEDVDRAVEIMIGHGVADVGRCAGPGQDGACVFNEIGEARDEILNNQAVGGKVRVYDHSAKRSIEERFVLNGGLAKASVTRGS